MIEPISGLGDKVLGFKLSGKLHDEDYKTFVPLVDEAIAKSGKVRTAIGIPRFPWLGCQSAVGRY